MTFLHEVTRVLKNSSEALRNYMEILEEKTIAPDRISEIYKAIIENIDPKVQASIEDKIYALSNSFVSAARYQLVFLLLLKKYYTENQEQPVPMRIFTK